VKVALRKISDLRIIIDMTIVRESLHDKVVRHLALKIIAGGFTTLPNEADLGKELNVSRSILRESIKVLAAKGLIEVGPTGTRARPRENWNLLDPRLLEWISEHGNNEYFFGNLCELRMAFEPKVAELAAQRATSDDIESIQAAWEEMRLASNDREAYNAADLRFHQAILAACRNELFSQVGGFTRIFLRMSFTLTSTTREHFASSLPLHKKVLLAIRKGDACAAKRRMEEVIETATAQISRLLKYDGQRLSRIQGRSALRNLNGRKKA
jgi:GntR family galactonate operon transcriptional repressor